MLVFIVIEDNISACLDLSICYFNIDDKKNSLTSLLKSFEYDTPRAEICCQLGYYYFNNRDYNKAAKYKENDPSVIYNKKYFESLKNRY